MGRIHYPLELMDDQTLNRDFFISGPLPLSNKLEIHISSVTVVDQTRCQLERERVLSCLAAVVVLMSSGFYSQNGRWPDPKSSKQKGGAGP